MARKTKGADAGALSKARGNTGDGLRLYRKENVWDMTQKRLEFIFDEIDNVVVNVSGGKDSTVLFELAYEIAKRKNKLPLKVMWVDQEAEWKATVDTVYKIMTRDGVEPYWFQIPLRITNATSSTDHFLVTWDPEREADWVHPRQEMAITENVYGVDRLFLFWGAMLRYHFPDQSACTVAGVRAEESPLRRLGLTSFPIYKWVTWGRKQDTRVGHYTFYPLYDWSYTDIWKSIACNHWDYNPVYDDLYRYGMHVMNMRVSHLHHEQAVSSLWRLQEIEPETFDKLVHRIHGINTAAHAGRFDYFGPKKSELPEAFETWREYRDYLMEHLLDDEERGILGYHFDEHDRKLPEWEWDTAWQVHITAILTHDRDGKKCGQWFHSGKIWEAQTENYPNWRYPRSEWVWNVEHHRWDHVEADLTKCATCGGVGWSGTGPPPANCNSCHGSGLAPVPEEEAAA